MKIPSEINSVQTSEILCLQWWWIIGFVMELGVFCGTVAIKV
ncbi:hypothetical protein A2U01_0067774, partial [Trifolium medium]|nr:hypothetical protein [Trifolium medium]